MSKGTLTRQEVVEQSYSTADALIANAQAYNGEVCIRCKEARGTVVDFVATPEIDTEMWVGIRHDPHTDAQSDGWITETPAVRNCIKLCVPEVSIVDEHESLFAEARDE